MSQFSNKMIYIKHNSILFFFMTMQDSTYQNEGAKSLSFLKNNNHPWYDYYKLIIMHLLPMEVILDLKKNKEIQLTEGLNITRNVIDK